MVYTVGDTLAQISRTIILRSGGRGTPSCGGYARTPPWPLHPGDVVEVGIQPLGILVSLRP